jgi:signal transduction histidine kinase
MSLSELIASAAEINEPLTGIIVNSEACLRFLAQDAPLDELRAAIDDIINDSRRASGMVRRLKGELERVEDRERMDNLGPP